MQLLYRFIVSPYFIEKQSVRDQLGVKEPIVPLDARPAIITDSWAIRKPYPLPPHHIVVGPTLNDYRSLNYPSLTAQIRYWLEKDYNKPVVFVSMGTESQQPPEVPPTSLLSLSSLSLSLSLSSLSLSPSLSLLSLCLFYFYLSATSKDG